MAGKRACAGRRVAARRAPPRRCCTAARRARGQADDALSCHLLPPGRYRRLALLPASCATEPQRQGLRYRGATPMLVGTAASSRTERGIKALFSPQNQFFF